MRLLEEKEAARKIRSLRTLTGLTQGEIANKIGVTLHSYRKCETKPFSVTMALLITVADAFGCEVSDFFVE